VNVEMELEYFGYNAVTQVKLEEVAVKASGEFQELCAYGPPTVHMRRSGTSL